MTTEAVSADSLKELNRLAKQLIEADAAVEAAEQALKDAKLAARKLREDEIPDYMQEIGITKVTLDSGDSISYKDDIRLEWDDEKRAKAFKWLEANDYGGLIKTTVAATFGKGELEQAKELFTQLSEAGHSAELDRDVHYQTMCAFLREQVEAGSPIPMEDWGAVSIKKATVTKPKVKRSTTR
jgi:hypothetical protein